MARKSKKEWRGLTPLAPISLVCGVAGFLGLLGYDDPRLAYLPQIVAIVTGIGAMVHMRVSRGAAKGQGFATLGIVLGIITLIGVPMAKQALAAAKDKSVSVSCMEHLREISKAVTLYEAEMGRRLPADAWTEELTQYIRDEKFYTCPGLPDARCGYFCNIGSSMVQKQGPGVSLSQVVQFCDGSGVWGEFGGVEKAVYRHAGKANVAFMDGHSASIAKGDTSVIWVPPAN